MNVYNFLDYLRHDLRDEFSNYRSLLCIHAISGDVTDSHVWLWLGGEDKLVGFAAPDETKFMNGTGQLQPRKIELMATDKVKAGTIIVDTSALIDGVVSRLVQFGMLKKSKIGIPIAATLELARLGEEGKRKDASLKEKSKRGLDELATLRRLADVEKLAELDLDLGEAVDWSVPLDAVARSTIMDKAIRRAASQKKSLLVTCDADLARLASTYPNVTVLYTAHTDLNLRYVPAWRLWWFLMNWGKEQELVFDYRYENGKIAKVRFSMQSDEEITLKKIE